MNDTQLTCFCTVVKEGSLANAAKALYVSQSSVSQMIKKLEDELGISLFCLVGKRLRLTYSGQRFYEHAQAELNSRRQLLNELRSIEADVAGELSISLSAKRANNILPLVLPSYVSQYPNVRFKIDVSRLTTRDRLRALCEGNCDIIFTDDTQVSHDKSIEYITLGRESLTLVVGKSYSLARRLAPDGIPPASIPFNEIAEEEMILLPPTRGSRIMADQLFDLIGKKPRVMAEVSSIGIAKSIVATGIYCTLSPEVCFNGKPFVPDSGNIFTIPVSLSDFPEGTGSRNLSAAYRKNTKLVTFQRAFLQTLTEVFRVPVTA